MGTSRTALAGVLGLACAAVLAAPAAAHTFEASSAGEVHAEAKRNSEGKPEAQVFTFPPFKLSCERAGSTHPGQELSGSSETLFVEMHYSRCRTFVGKFKRIELPGAHTRFLTPVSIAYHANGYVQVGGASEGNIENAGAIEVEIGWPFKCLVTAQLQTLPARAIHKPTEEFTFATYQKEEAANSNKKLFPTGFQDKLLLKNAITHIHYKLEAQEGGICELLELPEEGKSGAYSGTLDAEVKRANLLLE